MASPPTNLPMTFDDEFNSLSLNNGSSGVWSPAYDWSPNGLTNGTISSWNVNPSWGPTSGGDANVFSADNGVLSIGIKPTPGSVSGAVQNKPFLSGKVTTIKSFAQTYGYFEANLKAASGAGTESSFWLLPADGAWPPELDAMEILGNSPKTLVMTSHSNTDGTTPHWTDIPDATQGFHTYGVDWQPDKITWYFDGQQVMQQNTPSDMNKPMYVVLDTLTGTSDTWVGAPNSGTNSAMQVNYVRAYSSKPDAAAVTPSAAPESVTPPGAATTAAATSDAPAGGTSTLLLSVSEDAYGGDAQLSVAIDGKTIGAPQTVEALHGNGAAQDISFDQALTPGTHDVAVSFLNDAYDGTAATDRNLYVNGASVDGTPAAGAAATLWDASAHHFSVTVPALS